MYERRELIAVSAGIITISGCLGGGTNSEQNSQGDGDTSNSGPDSVSGQCNPSAIQGDPLDTVGWKTDADGIYELETLYLTLVNLVEFPVEVTATILFYGEGGATDVLGTSFIKNEILEGGESREFELGGYSADDFSVGLEINCP